MKRAISLLVAIVMIISMIPSVYATDESIAIDSVEQIAVALNADNGYFASYTWTPTADGELSLYQYTEKEIEVTLTQGDNFATSYNDDIYGFAVSMDVLAGEEVLIDVIGAVEEDVAFEITGNFMQKAGMTQDNPIHLNDLENVVTNKGTQWYAGYFSGTELFVTGPEGFTVTYNGEVTEDWWGEVTMLVSSPNPRMPVVFAITGDGEFNVNFVYPQGSQMNPAELYTDMTNYAGIQAGSQGYYLNWTAPSAGTLTLGIRAEDADWNPMGWTYVVNNLTTYVYGDTQWSDSDPVMDTTELTVAAGDQIEIIVNTYDPANPWSAPAGDVYLDATFVCETHGTSAYADNYDGTHNVLCQDCATVLGTEAHTFVEGVCACGAEIDGVETNPRDLTSDLLYDEDYTAIVTVPAGTTFYCMAYRVNGMTMTINDGEEILCTTDDMMTPYVWTLVNDGTEEMQFVIKVVFPVGAKENPAALTTDMSNYAGVQEGGEGYFLNWTAPADGTLSITFYAEDADWNELGWTYAINNLTTYTYGDTQWSDSDPVVNPAEITVAAGDLVEIMANTYDPANPWTAPAGDLYVTAAFACAEHGETVCEDNYDGTHNVNCAACGNTLATEEHTYVDGVCSCGASVPGTAENPHDLTNDLLYDGDFAATVTVPANTTYYCMAYRVNGMTMTINDGTPVECVTEGMFVPYTWTIVNDGAEAATYEVRVVFPVGTQNNPEVIFRPAYINVNIAEGNNQGYYYKWMANADGTLVLTCPTVEGVAYDVNMTNMSTYAQVWLQDSTDGTISLDVKAGDEVIIQVAVMPDDAWNIPALQTALTGEFVFPMGSQMNPEVIEELNWYYGSVNQAEGDFDGYYYTYTASASGVATFYFGFNEGLENYVLDIIVTNAQTSKQMSLLQDGVDNYGMELQVPVNAGDELSIQIVAIEDAEGNYAPAANEISWCGNFAYPAGSQQNPINIEWEWNDTYTVATAAVTVEAGETVYFAGIAGMELTVNGVATEMGMDGAFAIDNLSDAQATYQLALATPVGAYENPEIITVLPGSFSASLKKDGQYNYVYYVTEDGTITLTATEGVNITVDLLTYVEDSEWPISEQFALAEPVTDENWNYVGWNVSDSIVLDVVAGQELKIQVVGLTDWSDWTTPAVDYTMEISAKGEETAAITAQPQSVTVNSGETAVFSVATTGEVVSYKWQYKKLHVWFDTTMTGYNTDTLTVAATGARNGYDYRCIVTFADGTKIISDAADMAVETVINITNQPNDQLTALGFKGQFTVAAEGEGLKYTWEYKRPEGERWIETGMEGATKPTVYIETTTARDGYQYRCKITDESGKVVYSDPATLTVLSFTKHPADARTSAGANVNFTVETNEAPLKYQWQYSKDGNKWYDTTMPGYNTATLTVAATNARDGYQYRCVITGAKSSTVTSKVATLNVGEAAVITAQPQDVTTVAGANAVFTVAATDVYTYQWQYSKNGTTWYATAMNGATTDTLTVEATAGRNGYQYRCQIVGTDGGVVYTNVATLTVG